MTMETVKIIGKIASAAMVLMGVTFFVMYLIGGQALYDSMWLTHYGTATAPSVIWAELWSLAFIGCGVYDWKLMSD